MPQPKDNEISTMHFRRINVAISVDAILAFKLRLDRAKTEVLNPSIWC